MITQRSGSREFRLAAGLGIALLCRMAVPVRAQEQPAPPPPPPASPADQQSAAVIKRETKLVLVDVVVTDKKGNYIHDLTQNDFKVFEDNKEQAVSTFSSGADATAQPNGQRHYLILFFDNSTMAAQPRNSLRSTPDRIA
jgi:hypothetical protein